MREIRFRAWDKINNSFDDELFYRIDGGGIYDFDISNTMKIELQEVNKGERFVLQQYTGLKDKNGVEIYEGDIVKKNGQMPHKTIWHKYEYRLSAEYHNPIQWDKTLSAWDLHRWEVIGNIYENPELLKKEE